MREPGLSISGHLLASASGSAVAPSDPIVGAGNLPRDHGERLGTGEGGLAWRVGGSVLPEEPGLG